jgi:hypothetical protein
LDFHHPACFTALHEREESFSGEIVGYCGGLDWAVPVTGPQRRPRGGTWAKRGFRV